MRKIVFCEFNMGITCVELRMEGGILLSIDCIAVENEVANSYISGRNLTDWFTMICYSMQN